MDRGRSRRIQDLREFADQPIPEVPVERTERLVEQQNPGPWANARASATRWASPPDRVVTARRSKLAS